MTKFGERIIKFELKQSGETIYLPGSNLEPLLQEREKKNIFCLFF